MAVFSIAHAYTQPNEGGYASASYAASIGDSGGETYRGITRTYNPSWPGWTLIDQYKAKNGIPKYNSFINVAGLDKLVNDFYKAKVWDVNKLDQVHDQGLANILFDISTNSGTGTAAKSIQTVLQRMGNPTIAADGIIGPATIIAINNNNANTLKAKLIEYRKWWLNTYQAGKSYLNALLARVDRYTSFIGENKSTIIPVLLVLGLATAGGLLYANRKKRS